MAVVTQSPQMEFVCVQKFSDADQREFVRLSGDANPIHADADAAALMFTGGIILHGVHGLMWSLNCYLRTIPEPISIRSIQATFFKPILLDHEVRARAVLTDMNLKINLTVDGVDVTTAKAIVGPASRVAETVLKETPFPYPPLRRLADLVEAEGALTMPVQARGLVEKFSYLAVAVGPTALIGLGSLATLVGMECPGLYGVSTDVSADFSAEEGPLRYKVRRVDKRFSRVEIDVRGYGLSGRVGAFVNEPRSDGSAE